MNVDGIPLTPAQHLDLALKIHASAASDSDSAAAYRGAIPDDSALAAHGDGKVDSAADGEHLALERILAALCCTSGTDDVSRVVDHARDQGSREGQAAVEVVILRALAASLSGRLFAAAA